MATYLLAWNPEKWPWDSLDQDAIQCSVSGFIDDKWSCGNTQKIVPNDRVFLVKLGSPKPKGIIASGQVTSNPYIEPHWADPSRNTYSVKIRFDVLVDYKKDPILDLAILETELPEVHWTPQSSGITIAAEAAQKLEGLWGEHIVKIGRNSGSIPEIVDSPEQYWEGATKKVLVNSYERDPKARQACIDHHGTTCIVCRFDFEEVYGALGRGYIHVHHVIDLAETKERYEVDPRRDLVPVCPNCHTMLHKAIKPARTIDQLRDIITKNADSEAANGNRDDFERYLAAVPKG